MATTMTNKFVDLVTESPRQAEAEFPSLVEKSHMRLWRVGDKWPPPGKQVIWLTVGTYSIYDMEMLDKLEAKLSRETLQEEIYLFDIVSFPEFSFEQHLPGIARVFDGPVVGYWKEGVMEEKLSSYAARNWLMDRLGLPPLKSIERSFNRESRRGLSRLLD